jgi:hypothetical protein
MKLAQLRAIGHNIATSLASGPGLMIGVWCTDIFSEAKASPEGYLTVDFLSGAARGATPSPSLAGAIRAYAKNLDDLCARHETTRASFSQLSARYWSDAVGRRFVVTVVDGSGRSASDDYLGTSGARVRVLDALGRIRTRRWRRGGDSNSRYLAVCSLSKRVHSTTLPPLRGRRPRFTAGAADASRASDEARMRDR